MSWNFTFFQLNDKSHQTAAKTIDFQSRRDSRVSIVSLSVCSFVMLDQKSHQSSVKIKRQNQASNSSIKIKRQNQASKSSIKIKHQNQASNSSIKIMHHNQVSKSSIIKSLKYCFAAILNKAF